MQTLQLHDIKDLVVIPDYSFFIFIIVCILALVGIIALIFFIIHYFKNKNSQEKKAYEYLVNLDLSNSKQAAYAITKYAKPLLHNDRDKKLYEELLDSLQTYKYKKEVEPFSQQTKLQFQTLMDALDVK